MAEGKMEGVRHLLDVAALIVTDDATRARVLNAGHELLRVYIDEHQKHLDRYIDLARADFVAGVWRAPVPR